MILDAHEIQTGSELQADLCVIGGGAAGLTIALELANGPLDIIVLEGGGFGFEAETQALYEGEMTGATFGAEPSSVDLDEARLRYLGGTTNHWAGYCRPLQDIDFEHRGALDSPGWPLSRSDLDRWYERALEILELGPFRFDWQYWNDEYGSGVPLLDGEPVQTVMFQLSSTHFGSRYRDALERAENITVMLHANVTELVTPWDGNSVTEVRARTLTGVELTVQARAFVVATGGIETPRLLLASNEVRSAGIGNEHDHVGRYFCEHLHVAGGFALLDPPTADLGLYAEAFHATSSTADPDSTSGVIGALSIAEEVLRQRELLGMEAILIASEHPGEVPVQPAGVGADHVAPLVTAIGGSPPRSLVHLQVASEQQLNPGSRIVLTQDRDPLGMPRIALNWSHTAADRRSIIEGLKIIGLELGRAGVGRLQMTPGIAVPNPDWDRLGFMNRFLIDVDLDDPDGFALGTGNHHMCTTRMSEQPSGGVVDADCRVHSVANLYIAGSGVFASAGVATPTFTIVALAARLADHLKSAVLR